MHLFYRSIRMWKEHSALAIKGLLKDRREEGVIQVEADERGGLTGIVFQNVESHLLCTTVEDEVGFGPQNLRSLMVPPIVRKLTAHRLIGRRT